MPDPVPAASDALERQHAHRVPDESVQNTLREIRQRTLDLAAFAERALPPGRERACAMTKIDEARMWMCNAATIASEIKEPLKASA